MCLLVCMHAFVSHVKINRQERFTTGKTVSVMTFLTMVCDFCLFPLIFISPVLLRVCSSHSQQTKADQGQVSCVVPIIKDDGPKDQVTKRISPQQNVCLGWDIYVGFIIINTECLTWQTLFYITVCPVLQCWPMLVQLHATLKHAPSNWISLAPGKVKLWETLSLRRANTQNRRKEERKRYCVAARQHMNFLLWVMRNSGYHIVGNPMHKNVIALLDQATVRGKNKETSC